MNPFEDLIPKKPSPQQVAPQANPFADLIPNNQGAPAQAPAKPGFNYLGDLLGYAPNQQPTGILSNIFQSTIGSKGIAGVAQMPGKVAYQAMHPDEQVITPGQALGTTLNAGLTAGLGGTEALASNATTKLGKAALTAVEGAGIGTGAQIASNLEDKKPIGTDLKSSAIIGAAIPLGTKGLSAVKEGFQKGAQLSSEGIINKIIKPGIKDLGYGHEPAQGILNEGITANSLGDLKNKITTGLQELGQGIQTLGTQIETKVGKTLDLNPALKPLDVAMDKAVKLNNPTLLNSLNNVKIALTHDLTMSNEGGVPSIVKGEMKDLTGKGYSDAVALMNQVKDHVKFTGNPSDDKELNIAVQKTYGALREIMNKAADMTGKSEGELMRSLNKRYGDLSMAQQAVAHREIVAQRNNVFNLATKIGLTGSVALTVAKAVTTGDYAKAGTEIMLELAGAGVFKAIGSTAVQTRVAKFLNALAPEERQGILNSTPYLKNFYERLTGKKAVEGTPTTKPLDAVEGLLHTQMSKPSLSEQAGVSDINALTPFLELGRNAAKKAGKEEEFNKVVDLIKKDSPAVGKTANPEGGFSKAGLVAGVAGATGAVAAMNHDYNPAHVVNPDVKPKDSDTNKIREAIGYNETRGEKDPYSFSQSSGDPRYGKALGRYQITEAELKSYAPKLLGKTITAKEFLGDPKLQDEYINKKIDYLKSRGLTASAIFAAHRGGFSDLSKMGEKIKKYEGYVKSGMSQLAK